MWFLASTASHIIILVFTMALSAFISTWFRSPNKADPVQQAVEEAPSPDDVTVQAIHALSSHSDLENIVFTRSSSMLTENIKSFWSSQAQSVVPACVVRPRTEHQLSTTVRVLSDLHKKSGSLRVAVRSGGHSLNVGFASAENGINIDLSSFNSITLSDDKSLVIVGVGARWNEVYAVLDKLGLTVAGGRAADVGVGGLILGGGLSFFSPKVGFACDNALSFQVVLANGTVVTANNSTCEDLAIALRGGGNNFGIVISITLSTFPHGKMWTGSLYHFHGVSDSLLQSFVNFCAPEKYDPDCTAMIVFGFNGQLKKSTPLSLLQHHKATKNPPALRQFTSLSRFWSTMKVRSMQSAAQDVGGFSPSGLRRFFWTTTFEKDIEMLRQAKDIYDTTLDKVRKVKGLTWSLVFQPLVPAAMEYHARNAMGVHSNKTLIIALITINWDAGEDDNVVISTAKDLMLRIEAGAKHRGVYHPFKYCNYCDGSQDPYAGYGKGKLETMRLVSKKYDPQGFFQRSVSGGFKIGI